MALCKRNNIWWIRFSFNGKRIQQSTGTSDKIAAQQLHDKLKAEIWRADKLQEKPDKTWMDAVVRWLEESKHKRSLEDDIIRLRWLDTHLKNKVLSNISRDVIENVAKIKEKSGVEPGTVNRMLAVIRAILRKAEREWGWIDKAPFIRMRKEDNARTRWITPDEANRLLRELPPHLADMMLFTLATGLRRANVTGLKWNDIDIHQKHAWILREKAKGKKAIAVPLNEIALAVLAKRKGIHPEFVFTYKERRITQCSTQAWRKALKRAGITDFKWHDLRHTWSSWHVQNKTSLQELQQLGGWRSFNMVLRYAHLSSEHLKEAANRIVGTNLVQTASLAT